MTFTEFTEVNESWQGPKWHVHQRHPKSGNKYIFSYEVTIIKFLLTLDRYLFCINRYISSDSKENVLCINITGNVLVAD